MEPLLETIEVDADSSNELLFRVKVEGTDPAPAKVRLVCETGDVDFVFKGHSAGEDGLIQFVIPNMKGKLKEGTYLSRVEVLIENRFFSPVAFMLNFKQAVTVVAEAVVIPRKPVQQQVTVTAAPVVVKKPAPIAEAPKPAPKPVAPVEKKPLTLKERFAQKHSVETKKS